ncbi:MAG: nicotinamide mononucleotide transporter family protein [Ilumatobacter sp.]|uniref:nicotinamide mononucleotide transporter family protein n=1 Tax=Ilumatobacter sp. TaxID=1967498 RepID=UPI003299F1B3
MTDSTPALIAEEQSLLASPAPWFGRPWEHRQAAVAGAGSLVACGIYWAGTREFAPETTPGVVEFSATTTSLWSVWITQRRNVLALPIGIVSVILMGSFFSDIGLVGQQWLQWGYYLPIQFWAWAMWTRGGEGGGELLVTRLAASMRVLVLVASVAATILLGWVLDAGWDDAVYTYWDASIVAASVLAMLLLSLKKVESWWLWIGPVNISAIGLYLKTEANMFAALYVLFFVMAVVGLVRWRAAASRGVS